MDVQMDNLVDQGSSAYLIPFPVESFSKPVLLSSESTTIGRADSNIVQIADESVSLHHALIEHNDEGYSLKDLDSEKGSFINGRRITSAALGHHDQIAIGNRTFLFLLGASVAGGAPADVLLNEDDTIAISEEDIEPSDMLAQMARDAVRQLYHQPLALSQFNIEQAANAHERLSMLYQLSEELRGTRDVAGILDQGLALILKAVPTAERAMILLRAGAHRPLEVKAVKYQEGKPDNGTIPVSRTVLDWVLGERMALVSQDVTDDDRFEDSDSIRISSPNSIVCVPLLRGEAVLGVLYIESANILDPMTQEDAAFAAAVANELALNLDNIRLQRQALRNARMAAIGLTITNLAHNIKNLIMLNQNAMDLMGIRLSKYDDSDVIKTWGRIRSSFERINNLSSDMLEYAKEESTQLAPVDINEFLLLSREFFDQSVGDRHVAFQFDLTPDAPAWIMDKAQLQRAIINLVVNAIDALQNNAQGVIKISSSVEKDQRLIISVTDNGEGMAPEQLTRICDLFYTTKGTQGSGLGLPMVQKFVERLGGKLVVRSKPGVGSSFSMVFPRIEP
jgi:signal transduction histidine kinase